MTIIFLKPSQALQWPQNYSNIKGTQRKCRENETWERMNYVEKGKYCWPMCGRGPTVSSLVFSGYVITTWRTFLKLIYAYILKAKSSLLTSLLNSILIISNCSEFPLERSNQHVKISMFRWTSQHSNLHPLNLLFYDLSNLRKRQFHLWRRGGQRRDEEKNRLCSWLLFFSPWFSPLPHCHDITSSKFYKFQLQKVSDLITTNIWLQATSTLKWLISHWPPYLHFWLPLIFSQCKIYIRLHAPPSHSMAPEALQDLAQCHLRSHLWHPSLSTGVQLQWMLLKQA